MKVGAVKCFFFFNNTATTEIYTLSLHDALPIWAGPGDRPVAARAVGGHPRPRPERVRPAGHRRRSARQPISQQDRKSTRLNSSHANISYAVFCLKNKNLLSILTYRNTSYAPQTG